MSAKLRDGPAGNSAAARALESTWGDKPGLVAWLSTVDHKKIGVRFVLTAFVFFAMAGVLGGLIRHQLSVPDNTLLGPDFYNQVFTMHGTTMMFLFADDAGAGGLPGSVDDRHAQYRVPAHDGLRVLDLPYRRPDAVRRVRGQYRG